MLTGFDKIGLKSIVGNLLNTGLQKPMVSN
jgi:hypothetical protein